MMMPANFSAISENEMTYVEGGAVALADILAPVLEVSNWQKFNTNLVTIIGNNFVSDYVERTVGALFSGSYIPGDMLRGWASQIGGAYESGSGAVVPSVDAGFSYGSETIAKIFGGANGVLNAGLAMVGNAAAIYNLATGTVKNAVSDSKFTGFVL